jgi:hypothetical protein
MRLVGVGGVVVGGLWDGVRGSADEVLHGARGEKGKGKGNVLKGGRKERERERARERERELFL